MTKIAFASCMHVKHDPSQIVWIEAAAHGPDWIILGGDNIYMNYGTALFGPRRWSPEKFAARMLERYTAQFSVPAFRALVDSVAAGHVLGVWDDHDFAWNNSRGTSTKNGMPAKRLIARALFHHFFDALNQRPLPAVLPPLSFTGLPNLVGSSTPAYRALDVGELRVLLCDVRSHREKSKNDPAASLLGSVQEQWLLDEIANAGTKPLLVVSGSTMTDGKGQGWDEFVDFFEEKFLPAASTKRVMFLGGDVHENRLIHKTGRPLEIISSGAAVGLLLLKRNYGLLDVSPTEATILLSKKGTLQYSGRLDLGSGAFTSPA